MSTVASDVALIPTRNRVVVRPDSADAKSEAGIILPEGAKESPRTGVVMAVGPGTVSPYTGNMMPVRIDTGAHVLFESYARNEVKIEGETFLVMDESDVLGVIG